MHRTGMTTFNKYLDNPTVRITLFVGGIDEKVRGPGALGFLGSMGGPFGPEEKVKGCDEM